jgi:hypothetical protein
MYDAIEEAYSEGQEQPPNDGLVNGYTTESFALDDGTPLYVLTLTADDVVVSLGAETTGRDIQHLDTDLKVLVDGLLPCFRLFDQRLGPWEIVTLLSVGRTVSDAYAFRVEQAEFHRGDSNPDQETLANELGKELNGCSVDHELMHPSLVLFGLMQSRHGLAPEN